MEGGIIKREDGGKCTMRGREGEIEETEVRDQRKNERGRLVSGR